MPQDWNPDKNTRNMAKHGIGFDAVQDFDWATALVQADIRNSLIEVRLIALGVIGVRVHDWCSPSAETRHGSSAFGGQTGRRPAAMPRKLDLPSPEDDAAIQRGIEQDPDSPELGDEFFRNARPASMVLPPAVYADLTAPGGHPDVEPAKVQVTFPVDQDVFDGLQASGPGWQARANEALRRLVKQ